ncbi:phosphatase PAP2 family protein [Candidatus Woesearchaeota archaeon]|nr:phosphatase PAP2 family protein [Candidatus Woesearchaeota archaeon]
MDTWLSMRKELWHQISAFGGIALSGFVIVFSYLIGYKVLAVQFLLEIVLAFTIVGLIRSVYFSKRPDNTTYKSWLGRLDASSFPSMHCVRSFGLGTVISLNFPTPAIILLALLVSVAVAVSRVHLKRHRISDVIAGSILGILIGFASVWLTLRFI